MAAITNCLFVCLCISLISADDIERTARRGGVIKLLREMVNQTKADTLNLPANASSIRENITDTFSCENRTYGYYADVDNDCQVFHVCLTSQTSTGRNVTYRWSFICPNETIFNQEVLTCTRPRDSIDCADAPMFYHVNNDIGKVSNSTEEKKENVKINRKGAKPVKKQNIIVEKLMTEVKTQNLLAEDLEADYVPVIDGVEDDIEYHVPIVEKLQETDYIPLEKAQEPVIHEVGVEYEVKEDRMENARLSAERSLRRGKKMNRGSFRFKAVGLKNNLYAK